MKKSLLASILIPITFTGSAAILPASCTPTRDGGVFRSFDRGETFEQKVAISGKQTIAGIDSLTIKVDPQDSNIIYLGTRSEGIFKSMDGGDSWYRLNETNKVFTKRANVYDIAIDPKNNNNIFVGAYQDRFGRLFRSPDGGKNWEEVYRVSRERYAIFAVEVDMFDSSIIYMGSAEGGLLKSTDFGKSWRIINWFDDVISDIKVDPHDTKNVYVSTWRKGLFRTNDKGATWQHLDGVSKFPESAQIEILVMDNRNPNVLYTGSQTGLLKSTDGGQNWERVDIIIPPNSVPVTAIALDPVRASYLYYGAGNVLYRSQDNGQTWTMRPIATGRKIQVITIDSKDSDVVYLGVQR